MDREHDIGRVPPGGLLLAGLSVAVCSAVLPTALALLVHAYATGEPPSREDAVGYAVVIPVAALALWVSLRASRRSFREHPTQARHWLARSVPALAVVGLVVAGWVAPQLVQRRSEAAAFIDRRTCERIYGDGVAPEACLEVARACRHETRAGPGAPAARGVGAPPDPPGVRMPGDAMARARVLCVLERTAR